MKILILEYDPMVRNINSGFLNKLSYVNDVYEASDVETAKHILKTHAIELILLDVYLGEGSGPDLLKWVREEGIDSDVVLITADNSAQTVETAFRLGAIDYLIKPFNFSRFQEAIGKVSLRRKKLKKGTKLSQDALDEWFSKDLTQEKKSEKGINQHTYDTIKEVLVKSGSPLTAAEVGQKTELARVTVRRYLEHMVSEKRVVETFHYGKIGRPQKTYEWKDERASHEK